jgi:hypothetical protein
MKSLLTINRFKKKSALFAALMGTTLFFSACKNDIDTTSPAIAALSVVNAFPNTSPLDFYLGNDKVNNTGIAFGQKINYFQAYEGSRTFNLTFTGSLNSLLTKSIALKGGMYHSLYVVGKTPQDIDYLLVEDNPALPKENQVNIRFINLSPDAGTLSLELVGDTTKFDNKAFKGYTAFKPVAIAKSNFVLKDNATNTVKAKLDTVNLVKGKTYTFWAKGLAASSTDTEKLAIRVTEH